MDNTIRFWGVRGSIPTPGPQTARAGGNTSCVEVNLGGQRVIIDGGSGLRQLGMAQRGAPLSATLLFSHLHWDHIQGVPFCAPLFVPDSRVHCIGPAKLHAALDRQMSGPTFPVGIDCFAARLSFEEIRAGAPLQLGDLQARTCALSHPGGAIGYRLEHDETAVVYACDTEHPAKGIDEALLSLCRGAQTLIYDAQYLPEEYPSRLGWGHSTFEAGAALAHAAGVRHLVLTHHDPARDDEALARLERRAREHFAGALVAREGVVLSLDTDSLAEADAAA